MSACDGNAMGCGGGNRRPGTSDLLPADQVTDIRGSNVAEADPAATVAESDFGTGCSYSTFVLFWGIASGGSQYAKLKVES